MSGGWMRYVCVCILKADRIVVFWKIMASSWRYSEAKNCITAIWVQPRQRDYRETDYRYQMYRPFIGEIGRFLYPYHVIWHYDQILMTSLANMACIMSKFWNLNFLYIYQMHLSNLVHCGASIGGIRRKSDYLSMLDNILVPRGWMRYNRVGNSISKILTY